MRPRTILFAVAGLLVAGMLVFLALEVRSGGGSSSSDGSDPRAAGGAEGRSRGRVAARSGPSRGGERGGGEEEGDQAADGQEDDRSAGEQEAPRPTRVPVPAVGFGSAKMGSVVGPATSNTDPELEEKMASATASYDSGDYQAAHEKGIAILETSPRNIKMLRIVVSTSCMFGELDRARELNARLPQAQQEQMRKRCKRYGGEI